MMKYPAYGVKANTRNVCRQKKPRAVSPPAKRNGEFEVFLSISSLSVAENCCFIGAIKITSKIPKIPVSKTLENGRVPRTCVT